MLGPRLGSTRPAACACMRRPACPSTAATWRPCCNSTSPNATPRARTALSAKDYLLFELTGLRLTEPSTAAGYGIYDLEETAIQRRSRRFLAAAARSFTENSGRQYFGRPLERNRGGVAWLARGNTREHRGCGLRLRIVCDGGTRRALGIRQFGVERRGHRQQRNPASGRRRALLADTARERQVVRTRDGPPGHRLGLSLVERIIFLA